jgi:hypothetical protein
LFQDMKQTNYQTIKDNIDLTEAGNENILTNEKIAPRWQHFKDQLAKQGGFSWDNQGPAAGAQPTKIGRFQVQVQ